MLSFEEQSWLFLREFTREILTNINSYNFRAEVRKEIKAKLNTFVKDKEYVIREHDESVVAPIIDLQTLPKFSPPAIVSSLSSSFVDSPIVLGRIGNVFSTDVYVVECLGPNKPLIVKKPGKEESLAISLSEDDIKRVVADFAHLAKSYPTEGVFNANYNNYSMTAVLSDLAGSRFVITKYLDVSKLIG